MSTASVPKDDLAVLAQQLDALNRESAALSAALARARRVRLLLFLGFLALVVIVGATTYRIGNKFRQKDFQDAYMAALTNKLQSGSDRYQREVQSLVEKVSPVVSKAFTTQVENDAPKLMAAIEKERDPLIENLREQLSVRLQKHYDNILAKHDALLKKRFPELQDEQLHERLVLNLRLALDKMYKRYYLDELERQVNELVDRWEAFPPAEAAKKNDPPLNDQLTGNLLQLVAHRITHLDEPAGATGR